MPKPTITPTSWIYLGRFITDISQLPDDTHGFIYKITDTRTGKWYIGKKNLYSTRNIKLGKKALAAREDKRTSKKKTVVAESDWKTYFGSELQLVQDVQRDGHDVFRREIIVTCRTKGELTYQEARYQILGGCLESDNCYNRTILGKFFRSSIKQQP